MYNFTNKEFQSVVITLEEYLLEMMVALEVTELQPNMPENHLIETVKLAIRNTKHQENKAYRYLEPVVDIVAFLQENLRGASATSEMRDDIHSMLGKYQEVLKRFELYPNEPNQNIIDLDLVLNQFMTFIKTQYDFNMSVNQIQTGVGVKEEFTGTPKVQVGGINLSYIEPKVIDTQNESTELNDDEEFFTFVQPLDKHGKPILEVVLIPTKDRNFNKDLIIPIEQLQMMPSDLQFDILRAIQVFEKHDDVYDVKMLETIKVNNVKKFKEIFLTYLENEEIDRPAPKIRTSPKKNNNHDETKPFLA